MVKMNPLNIRMLREPKYLILLAYMELGGGQLYRKDIVKGCRELCNGYLDGFNQAEKTLRRMRYVVYVENGICELEDYEDHEKCPEWKDVVSQVQSCIKEETCIDELVNNLEKLTRNRMPMTIANFLT